MSDGGAERGSYVEIKGGKVFGTLSVGADEVKVSASAALSSALRLEVTCRGGGTSGLYWWASIVMGADAAALPAAAARVYAIICW